MCRALNQGLSVINTVSYFSPCLQPNCLHSFLLTPNKIEVDCETERQFYRDIDVYVNVEPCIQCCTALLQIGPPRAIFYGCANDRFGGCGSVMNVPELLGFHNSTDCSQKKQPCSDSDKCILISGGHRSGEAIELLKTFYKGENLNAPKDKRKPTRN